MTSGIWFKVLFENEVTDELTEDSDDLEPRLDAGSDSWSSFGPSHIAVANALKIEGKKKDTQL